MARPPSHQSRWKSHHCHGSKLRGTVNLTIAISGFTHRILLDLILEEFSTNNRLGFVGGLHDLLTNWERFLHDDDDIDPLIKMAVGHYQFEAIHPFYDGNGRTGRILDVLYLIECGLLTLPILYLSRFIVHNKQDYYSLLNQVTKDQNWENWLLFMLKGIEQTAIWTCDKITAIKALSESTTDYIKAQLPKIYSYELVQLIFEQPYCRISNLVERDIAKRQTASTYLKQLADIGVLQEINSGKEKLFVHPRLMTLMTKDNNSINAF